METNETTTDIWTEAQYSRRSHNTLYRRVSVRNRVVLGKAGNNIRRRKKKTDEKRRRKVSREFDFFAGEQRVHNKCNRVYSFA